MKHIFHIFSFVIFYMTIGFLGIHAQERLYTSYERGGSENGVVGKINGELDVSPIAEIQIPGVQDWSYAFDPVGNLVTRQDNSRNLTETYKSKYAVKFLSIAFLDK